MDEDVSLKLSEISARLSTLEKDIDHRMGNFEAELGKRDVMRKVTIAVATVFGGLFLIIATWYLNRNEATTDQMVLSLQEMSVSMAELRVSMEFYASSFATHISVPNNHPDNTDRVNRVIEDLQDLHDEVERHEH